MIKVNGQCTMINFSGCKLSSDPFTTSGNVVKTLKPYFAL